MERYDRLRAEGADPGRGDAPGRPGFDAPPMWTGQPGPGPDRAARTEQAATRRPGVAEITRYRGETATTQRVPAARTPHYEARAGSLADPVRMASRSLSESPPQTPWGSGAANAWARQSATTGQPRQMAAAACSRRRCSGPRLPSGWKNSSGLAPRQAPCRCQRHFSVDDPGRPRRSAIGTSRRVVTTVIAPEVVRPPTRLGVVDRPGRNSPTRVACGLTQQHYDAAAPPVPDLTPVQENRDLLMRNRPSGALGAVRGSPARLGNARPTGGAVTPPYHVSLGSRYSSRRAPDTASRSARPTCIRCLTQVPHRVGDGRRADLQSGSQVGSGQARFLRGHQQHQALAGIRAKPMSAKVAAACSTNRATACSSRGWGRQEAAEPRRG